MEIKEVMHYIEQFDDAYERAIYAERKKHTVEEKIDFLIERQCVIDTLLPLLVEQTAKNASVCTELVSVLRSMGNNNTKTLSTDTTQLSASSKQ